MQMRIQLAFCLLSLAFLPACSTTSQTTGANQTLEQRLMAKYASNATEPVAHHSGIAVSKHDYNYVVPAVFSALDQTFAGGFGVTGLHSVAVGKALQELVRVFQFTRSSVRVAEHQLWQTHDRPDRRVRIGD